MIYHKRVAIMHRVIDVHSVLLLAVVKFKDDQSRSRIVGYVLPGGHILEFEAAFEMRDCSRSILDGC